MSAIWPGALLVVYLGATGVVLLFGRERIASSGIALHFSVAAAIAAATWLKIVPHWLRAWAPLMALLFLYSEIPMLIGAVGHAATFDGTVIAWERAAFGGQPALEWAARVPSLVLSETLHVAYLSYYPIIASVPAVLWLSGRRMEFYDAVFVLMLTFIVCFATYLVFPVAGPRYFWTPASPPGLFRTAAIALLEARSSRGTAFPSSHVAVAITQSLLAVRFFGAKGWPIAALTLGLALGAVYGGFHYAVDVVAGVGLGIVVTGIGTYAVRRRASIPHANAIAPTYPASAGPDASPSSS